MRRWWVVVRTTVLETCSEPLALLLTLCAVLTISLTSAMHFHQFGEPTRMSRDAGLSALIVFGLCHAAFCTIKVFRRELESGTIQMALSHPISRTGFLIAKLIGVSLASLVFTVTLSCATVVIVTGAEVGGFVAMTKGDLAILWPNALYINVCVLILPLVVAAMLDRFLRFRFTTTAMSVVLVLALLSVPYALLTAYRECAGLLPGTEGEVLATAKRLLPALAATYFPLPVFVAASAAFAVRFRDHVAMSLSAMLLLLAIPVVGNYCLSDALAKGGSVSWGWVALLGVAAVPFLVAFVLLGAMLFQDRDVG